MIVAVSLLLIAAATLMFLGWGWAFLRLFRVPMPHWTVVTAVGLASVVFLGGILNLVRLAYPAALAAIFAVGLFLAIVALRSGLSVAPPRWMVGVPILAIVIFTIVTQLPPSIYNFHDDYQKYFAYPVRMTETGTVFGSPLSAIGLQTLGGQAFLDAFVTAFFPIRFINGVDAVFGLFLCLLVATQAAGDRKDLLPMTVMAVLSVEIVNPQYVNISTLFCGSALIMASVAVESAAGLGVIYAALIAMKPIFAVFIAIQLLSVAVIGAKGFRWAIRTGLAAGAFLAPWVLIHAPNYLAALRARHTPRGPLPSEVEVDSLQLWSFARLPYGSTAANYTLLVLAFAACGFICWKLKPPALNPLANCVSAILTLGIFFYVLGPMQYGYEHGLRYFVPVAIGLAPPIFGYTAIALPRRRWLPLAIAVVPLAAFGSSLGSRISTEFEAHTAVSYAWLAMDADYAEYNRKVLSGSARDEVMALQQRVPPEATILAWINTPFYLNYRRNQIVDIDTAGIGVPWAKIPPAGYLMWDYGGFATEDEEGFTQRAGNPGAGERKDSLLTLAFINRLKSVEGEVLYDDGEIRLIKLKTSERNLR